MHTRRSAFAWVLANGVARRVGFWMHNRRRGPSKSGLRRSRTGKREREEGGQKLDSVGAELSRLHTGSNAFVIVSWRKHAVAFGHMREDARGVRV